MGSKRAEDGANDPGAAAAGSHNMTPVGLGFLLSSGDLGDARLFYCPSSVGMVDRSLHFSAFDTYGGADVADQPADLQKSGGFNARTMSHGNWDWLGPMGHHIGSARYSYLRTVLSHYSYRCVPLAGAYNMSYWGTPARMYYTKPDKWVRAGEPVFKTQKQLGGRALVTDTWGKTGGDTAGGADPDAPSAGEGLDGHREGYSALYGDWHARWYGDPQEKLIWWPLKRSDGSSGQNSYYFSLASAQMTDIDQQSVRDDPTARDVLVSEGQMLIWHNFDVGAGIDVGVDDGIRDW